MAALERIIRKQEQGSSVRASTRFASFIFYGALEEILTGWVMGQLPDTEEDVHLAERTVVEMLCDGLLATAPAPA